MGFPCISGNKECDGCMGCEAEAHYYCPVCGEEVCESVFVSNSGDVVGCENCTNIKEPYEVLEYEID